MKPIAPSAEKMPRSGIRVILDLAAQIPDAIHLEIGQPNFPTPAFICDAAYRAIQQGFTGYTANAGLLSLREAIAEKVRRENGLKASPENIVVTTGGMGGLFSTLTTLLAPGDEVLIPDPGFPNYEMMAVLQQAPVVRYPLDAENGFQLRLETLPGLLTSRSKVLMVNSPSNPTGAVISPETMAALLDFARRNDLYLVSDECYEKIIFDAVHFSPGSLDNEGRVVSIFSFSKTYAMTGWRVGFVVAPVEIAAVITKLQEATVSCAASVSQKAAEAALYGSQDCVAEMVSAYRRRRDRALDILRQHGLPYYAPQGAFYMMIDISRCGDDSYQVARQLLLEEKVAVAPGATFGPQGNRYVRISLAADDAKLEEGLERLCRYITRRLEK